MKFQTPGFSLLGGITAGIAASLCCVGPLVVLMLGMGGAWVSNLTALEPYRPLFILFSLVALFYAYRSIFSKDDCEEGKVCAVPPVRSSYKLMFWLVTAIVVISVAAPYLIPLFV